MLLEETPLRIQVRDLRLLVELPSWSEVFFGNLRDLVSPPKLPRLQLRSAPAPFWSDVFVKRDLPWRRFLQSSGYHVLALALLVSASRFIAMQPQPAPPSNFDHTQVIYYQPAEYLPPLDTRSAKADNPAKADPEFSRQPVISVPREADNRSQTIVTPPDLKLKHDVALPNIVAWSDRPQLPIAPAPLVPASSVTRLTPQLERSVVAPPPDPTRELHHRDPSAMQPSVVAPPPDITASERNAFQAPQPSVVEPPPIVENSAARSVGDINIGHTSVIAPAPQLAVSEQRAVPGRESGMAGSAPQVVPPPPSFQGSGSSGGGRIIALNLHPAVGAPQDPPQGNRRGTFAATPEGHAGASGDPGAIGGSASGADGHGRGSGRENGSGSGKSGNTDLPTGLYVGNAANPAKTSAVAGDPAAKTSTPANTVNPNLLGSVLPPRVTSTPARPLQPESETKLSEPEREVFGSRKFYSLTLNMPNLNSAGGSWVIRFAELKQDPNASAGLSAPAATRKVDPAYPLQVMRENVSGTVILYAVIRADGTVGNVRIIRSVDDHLDQFAKEAIAKWQFQPAMKNGAPVDVEATFQIPFHPARRNF
jgi:TonB family protein